MAGLNVFTQMMIEAIMYVGIGLLLGCLIAVAVTPLVHNRAVRLTTRRLETALPQSMEEIQAGKDLLRAEFAMYARRLELINEWQKNKITSQLVELSKKSDVINWLKRDRDRLHGYSLDKNAVRRPPLVIARGRDHAAATFEGIPEYRLLGHRLRAGVEDRRHFLGGLFSTRTGSGSIASVSARSDQRRVE
jgi:uncharacterized membrane protein YccC